MKNTIENKTKFFVQYWGQNVAIIPQPHSAGIAYNKQEVDSLYLPNILHLELKSLSKISHKDLYNIDFGNIGDKTVSFYLNNSNYMWMSSCGKNGYLTLEHTDYLRSKGYAVPFNGVGVDTLIEWGWIKII